MQRFGRDGWDGAAGSRAPGLVDEVKRNEQRRGGMDGDNGMEAGMAHGYGTARRDVEGELSRNGAEERKPTRVPSAWEGGKPNSGMVGAPPSPGSRDGGPAPGREGGEPGQVWPRGGTLVLFDSQAVQHEVAPSGRERWALTLWVMAE